MGIWTILNPHETDIKPHSHQVSTHNDNNFEQKIKSSANAATLIHSVLLNQEVSSEQKLNFPSTRDKTKKYSDE